MKTISVSIEKISNGFVITIDGKKTFCDVPEAICGELAQWALKTCEDLQPEKNSDSEDYMKLMKQLAQAQQQAQLQWHNPPLIGQPTWMSTCTTSAVDTKF